MRAPDEIPGTDLARLAAERALGLPATSLSHPFGPDWDVYKVRDRVFLLITEHLGEQIVTCKARPEDGRALREAFTEISPGYHMNKRHWITMRRGSELEPALVSDLVTESYLLVVEGLPRRLRPVDPERFGQESPQ